MSKLENLSEGKSRDPLGMVACPKCSGDGCSSCAHTGKITKTKLKRLNS